MFKIIKWFFLNQSIVILGIIGVSSGASVPEILVQDLLKDLAIRGYTDVETITATEEHLLFAIPQELRKELKAAQKQ